MSKDCRKSQVCMANGCTIKHHSLLHRWVTEKDCIATQPSVSCAATNTAFSKSCLGIFPVVVKGSDGNPCRTYALLDDGADKMLCDERLLKSLNISSRPVIFRMSTVSSTGSTIYGQEVNLGVQPLNGNDAVSQRNVWSVKRLPISTKSAAVNADIKNFPHLSDIDLPKIDTKNVKLLIGTDCPGAHIPLEVRSGNYDQPYAIRTRLRWAIRGPFGIINAFANSRKGPKSKKRSKSSERSRSRTRSKSRERPKSKEMSKSRKRSKSRERSKSKERPKSRERSKSRKRSKYWKRSKSPKERRKSRYKRRKCKKRSKFNKRLVQGVKSHESEDNVQTVLQINAKSDESMQENVHGKHLSENINDKNNLMKFDFGNFMVGTLRFVDYIMIEIVTYGIMPSEH